MKTPKKPSTPSTRSSSRLQKKVAAAQDQTGLHLSQPSEGAATWSRPASERRGRPSVSMLLEDIDTPRHLINNIMLREPAKSPVLRKRRQSEQPGPGSAVTSAQSSVPQEQPTHSTHHRNKRLKKNAGPETPKSLLKQNMKARLRSSLGGPSQPASEIKKASVHPTQQNPFASMLLEDGDTPRHLMKKILQREPAKSPVTGYKGHSKQPESPAVSCSKPPESPAASFADTTFLPRTQLSSLDLPDITVGNLASTTKLCRKRPRKSLNLTVFEKKLLPTADTDETHETLDVDLASLTSLSQGLSDSTIWTEKGALQRKVPNRRKMSKEELDSALAKWGFTAMKSFKSEQNYGEVSNSDSIPDMNDEVVTSMSKSGATETSAAMPPSALTSSNEEPINNITDNQDSEAEDAEAPEVGVAGSFSEDEDVDAEDAEAAEVGGAGSLSEDEDVEAEDAEAPEVGGAGSLSEDEDVEAEDAEAPEVGGAGSLSEDEDEDAEAPEVGGAGSLSEDEDVEVEDAEAPEVVEAGSLSEDEEVEAEDAEAPEVGGAGSLSEDEDVEAEEEGASEASSPLEIDENMAESLNNAADEEDRPEQQHTFDGSRPKIPDVVQTKKVYPLPERLVLTSVPGNTAASGSGSGGTNSNQRGQRVKRPKRKCPAWEKKIFSKRDFVNAFKHYAGTTVSRDIYPYLNATLDQFYTRLVEDLETYANHAGRTTITAEDAVLLLKRQGHVNDKVPVEVLIEKHLSMTQRSLLLPTASRAMHSAKKKK